MAYNDLLHRKHRLRLLFLSNFAHLSFAEIDLYPFEQQLFLLIRTPILSLQHHMPSYDLIHRIHIYHSSEMIRY